MIRHLFFGMCGFLLLPGQAMALGLQSGDAGEVYQFQTVRSSFAITNNTQQTVRDLVVTPFRPQDRVVSAPTTLEPGQTLLVEVAINTVNDLGIRWHSFRVAHAESEKIELARVRVYGMSVLQDPARDVDFGQLKAGESPAIEVPITSDDPSVRITSLKAVPEFLNATIADGGRSLTLRHSGTSDWGKLSGVVKVGLSSTEQNEAWVPVQSSVRGAVVPSTDLLVFGIARTGQRNEYVLQYRSVDNKPVVIERAVLSGFIGELSVQNCVGGETNCRQVRFSVSEKQPLGQISGGIAVDLPAYGHKLFVPVGGMFLTKDAKVKQLDESTLKKSSGDTPPTPAPPSLTQALKAIGTQSMETSPPPAPDGIGPVLRWTVGNESSIYAYAIYRSEAEDGVFRRVGKIVKKAANAQNGVSSSYAFRDVDLAKESSYWYRIAILYDNGKKEFLSGPQRVGAGKTQAKE